ncbi:MAG: hypothetical protein RBR18_16815 [Desulfovibrionaceae bacterium]|nr:hypothetical protein [Desulfovibrionaceae bacterium]
MVAGVVKKNAKRRAVDQDPQTGLQDRQFGFKIAQAFFWIS